MAGLKLFILKLQPHYALVLLAVALLSLGGAYTAEYGFGLKPCVLCLYQRIPYAVVVAASFLMLVFKKSECVRWWLVLLCALALAAGAAIAFFHVGVEQHWWKGLAGCSGNGMAGTLEELRAQIMGAPVVRCDQPAFVFLGISMAGYNFLWSAGLAAIFIYASISTCRCSNGPAEKK